MSRFSTFLLVTTFLLAAVYLAVQPGPVRPVTPEATPVPQAAPPLPVRLEPWALRWGIAAGHQQGSGKKLTGLRETMGAGLCVFDANGDGWPDLFVVGGSGSRRHFGEAAWWYRGDGNRLFLNRGGAGFVDATGDWGLESSGWGMGCAAADLDGDTRPELLVYGVDGNQLYHHAGDRYSLLRDIAPLDAGYWTMGASIADFNRDGRADIYLSNYVDYRKGEPTFEAFSGFDVTDQSQFDASLFDAQPNQLLVNLGGLAFEDRAELMGVSNAQGRSLGARWLRLDGDEWLDLLVLNQHGTPNALYLNNAGRDFTAAPTSYAPLALGGAHDLSISLRPHGSGRDFLFTRGAGFSNALIRESSGFSDISRAAGLGDARALAMRGWGAVEADFNNDGQLDLYVANGQLLPDTEARRLSAGQPDDLYLGAADGFLHQGEPGGSRRFVSSRAVASADFDGDGRVDLAVAANNSPLAVYRNTTESDFHWLAVAMSDPGLEGTRVRVSTPSSTQEQEFPTVQGFLAQSERLLRFGVGAAATADVTVLLPDGTAGSTVRVEVDRIITVDSQGRIGELQRDAAGDRTVFPGLQRLAPAARMPLARAAAQLENPELTLALWSTGDADLRRELLAGLRREDGLLALRFVEESLSAADADLVAAGLAAAQSLEFERSIDWLIGVLDRQDAELVCRAARVLEHFFEQEEAAVRRKYLAVVPLIQQLDRPAVSACTARALGPAEKKRSVGALLALLEPDVHDHARLQAVRSLGLVRDTAALAPLRAAVTAADPGLAAASRIARVRLGETPQQVLSTLDKLALEDELLVLAALFADEDAAVLSGRPLDARLASALARVPADPPRDIELAAIRAMGASAKAVYVAELRATATSLDPEIARLSYVALAQAGAPPNVFAGLAQRDLELVAAVLGEAPPFSLSPDTLARLLSRGVAAESLRPQIARLGARDLAGLFDALAASGMSPSPALLTQCAELARPLDPAPYRSLPQSLQASDVALACFLYPRQGALSKRDLIARRTIIRQVMVEMPAPEQHRLRQKLAGLDSFYADATLFEPLLPDAAPDYFRYLASLPADQARTGLARVADDRRLDTIVRTTALEQLARLDPERAGAALEAMLK